LENKMSENQTNSNASPATDKTPVFQIQRVYLKDISLEQPNAPQIFLAQGEPQVQIQIDIQTTALNEGIFQVVVIGNVTTTVEEKVLFLIEAQQAGIFELRNIPPEQLDPMLGIACPTILYPYLRANIADLIGRGGFQPIHLTEINFHQLYEQRMQRIAEAEKKATSTSDSLPN
jgi:preprotein translocase subunit SecB